MDHSVVFKQVDHIYSEGTPFESKALHDVSAVIPSGKVTAIVGHTGSGKSTLIQHLNVLLRPSKGSMKFEDYIVTKDSDHGSLKPLRKKVGLVFQFPESQLFEETVLKDVMFGPLNFKLSEEEAERIARDKLALVGLPDYVYDRSPFDLSGGQMRRVAIAGVLALEPQVLVLDEPTAGLDPLGHRTMMEMFVNLQKQDDLTLVMVTHQMDDVAKYADNVIVMDKGTVVKTGSPRDVFADSAWLNEKQLDLPLATAFLEKVKSEVPELGVDQATVLSVEDLADQIVTYKDSQNEGVSHVR